MQEMWVWSLGQDNPGEEEMATHSSIPAWEIPWMEEPGSDSPWGPKELYMTRAHTHEKTSEHSSGQLEKPFLPSASICPLTLTNKFKWEMKLLEIKEQSWILLASSTRHDKSHM